MIRNFVAKFTLLSLLALLFVACDDAVTYSEMKEKERNAVNRFIKENGIKVISFADFVANDSVTDVAKNEFVEIDGVYMQIVNNPADAADALKLKDGESRTFLVRYNEYNIQEGDTISTNIYMGEPDEMRVTNNSGTFTATFTSGVMMALYSTSYVPSGWLTPFGFLYFTRSTSNLAKVNLIVPHTKGTSNASTYVYPCLYSITFQPERSYVYDED